MSEIITIGLDLAKDVFQLHGADQSGNAVLRKTLRRDQVLPFFQRCHLVLSPWRHVAARIFGDVESGSWSTKSA